MPKATDRNDLLKIAASTGIAAEQLARWHFQEGPYYISRNPGRPKGKIKRPAGTLSIGECRAKYHLKTETLMQWRKAGLPFRTIGTLIAIKEKDIVAWMKKASLA